MMKILKIVALGAIGLSSVAAFGAGGGYVLLNTPTNMTLVKTTNTNTDSTQYNYGALGAATVLGMADFDANGYPDLLVRDTGTGTLRLWCFSAGAPNPVRSVTIPGIAVASTVVGCGSGKLNNDANLDVLTQDSVTKVMTVYTVNKNTLAVTKVTTTTPYYGATLPLASEYDQVVAVGDFDDATGSQEVMLQNTNPLSAEYRWLRWRGTTQLYVINQMSKPIQAVNATTNLFGVQAPANPVVGSFDANNDGDDDLIIGKPAVGNAAKRVWTLDLWLRTSNVNLWANNAIQPYANRFTLAVCRQ